MIALSVGQDIGGGRTVCRSCQWLESGAYVRSLCTLDATFVIFTDERAPFFVLFFVVVDNVGAFLLV